METLLLPSELTIYTVDDLRPTWLAWVERESAARREATVDGVAVDQVDGAGVQLLVALQRCLAARGCTLRLHTPSAPLRRACTALGLSVWLEQLGIA